MNIKKVFRKFSRLVSPTPPVGSLEITDLSIRFLEIRKEGSQAASLKLPPGVIEEGKIKGGQRANLISALKNVHSQITADNRKTVNVVLSLPDSDVYIQSFSIPKIAESNIRETADLNLKMLSPIPIETSYYGWQKVGEDDAGGGTIELLGAFIPSSNVDEIVIALHEAGFGIAAVEFAALSLVRKLNHLKAVDNTAPYLIVHLVPEGLDFMVVKNGNLYFDYFYPWRLVQSDSRNITIDRLKETVESELRKVINFYLGHWGTQIKNIILITPSLEKEIREIIMSKFPTLEIKAFKSSEVTVVGGAALRGKILRAEDTDISLTSESAAKIFEQEQIVHFAAIWRGILLVIAGFILLVFSATDIYLTRAAQKFTESTNQPAVNQAASLEVRILQDKAKEFNRLVGLVSEARSSNRQVFPFLSYVNQLGQNRVSFDRIYLQSMLKPVIISGTAPSEATILDFKKRIESQPQFSDVKLPISSIVTKSNGQLGFDLTFLIKSLSFPVEVSKEEVELQEEKKQTEATLGEELVSVSEALKSESPTASGPLIVFGKLNFKSTSEPATLDISALNEETAYLFRDKLEESRSFRDVQIITGFSVSGDGRIKFQIRFSVDL